MNYFIIWLYYSLILFPKNLYIRFLVLCSYVIFVIQNISIYGLIYNFYLITLCILTLIIYSFLLVIAFIIIVIIMLVVIELYEYFTFNKKILPLIPITKYNNTSYNTKCVICQYDLVINDNVMVTTCDHVFHDTCMTLWLENRLICPICRKHI